MGLPFWCCGEAAAVEHAISFVPEEVAIEREDALRLVEAVSHHELRAERDFLQLFAAARC